ncbi:MAG: outer membrane protein assembly factor BamB family protein [Pirellulaceae bacterium]
MKHTCLFVVLCCFASVSLAEDWTHWRGPFFNGSTDETNLPSHWSVTDNANLRWTAELPGPSAATPIICRDRVFISSTVPDRDLLVAICLDRLTGQELWRRDVATPMRRSGDSRSTYSAPSPVTDGNLVYFFYGNGTLVAFDFDGKEIWKREIEQDNGPFAFQWTFSSTPLLHAGKLYLQVLQRDVPVGPYGLPDQKNESYLLAMDPATGKTLWQHVRPSDAYLESREAFSSPIPFQHAGRPEILVVGGDCLSGHDPESGAELWRWGTWNPERIGHWRLVPSPVAGGDVILACGPKGSPIYAVRAGGNGTLDDSALAWVSKETREISSDVPTPAFYRGDFFVLNDGRSCLSRVEPGTGKAKWTVNLPRRDKFEASPLAADGKIYVINFAGLVVVVDAEQGTILQQIPMAERTESPIRSSIAAAQGNLFVRTNDKLYCVGK